MRTARIALVTGAAQGLGRAIAERLAKDGCTVLVADIRHDDARNAARDISATGQRSMPLALDVSDETSVSSAYAEIAEHFGRLDILVNNAGIAGQRAPVELMPLAAWEKTLRVNLTGVFLMSRGAIPLMRSNGWGRIVNMSSLTARGQPGLNRSNYTATKAGIIGLSRLLADEVGRDGITVNCIAPGRIMTALTRQAGGDSKEYFERGATMTALGRLGEPEDIAHAVSWLCSDRAGSITGGILDINGGAAMI